jgi:hypothetical protein
MAATFVFTIVLLALLYININDEMFRRQLMWITGGLGLFVSIVFGVRAAWYSLAERMVGRQKSQLQSIQRMILVASVTAYFGIGAIVNAQEAWQEVGARGAVNFAIAFIFSAIAIYGFMVLTGLIITSRREK